MQIPSNTAVNAGAIINAGKKQVSMQTQRECECKFPANTTVNADENTIGSVKASAKANATKITNASTNISANAMRLMQKPMQMQNASAQANATKVTNASTTISANAMPLIQKPMQLQIQKN